MKPWMMPRVLIERFAANEYISGCEFTETVYRIDTPIRETNGLQGWQQHSAPAGYTIDSNGVREDGTIYVGLDDLRIVPPEEFSEDDTNTYYMITLKEDVESTTGRVYHAGDILYKNYMPPSSIMVEKNQS